MMPIPKNDVHPRKLKLYKGHEHMLKGTTSINQGDWRLDINCGSEGVGYRRYHKHGEVWYCVVSYSYSNSPLAHEYYTWENQWMCGHCKERVPKEMEGYIKLARYSLDDA